MELVAGQVLTATLLNARLRKRIARARRTSNSSGSTSTTAVAVMRLDDKPLIAGHNYKITWKGNFDTTTTTDTMRGYIRYTTDGSTPTTSSAILPGSGGEVVFVNASSAAICTVETDYTPVLNEILSLLLCIQHNIGTSSCILQADGSTFTTDMYIDDMGEDPGNTGTNL